MKMTEKDIKRLLLLNLPYVLIGLFATNLGEAWRIAEGLNTSEKIRSFMTTVGTAFENLLPSFYPFDLMVGMIGGAAVRLAVYLKGKNAKKYRHKVEYGSARWSA